MNQLASRRSPHVLFFVLPENTIPVAFDTVSIFFAMARTHSKFFRRAHPTIRLLFSLLTTGKPLNVSSLNSAASSPTRIPSLGMTCRF
eukprot:gene2078-biopygen2042